MSDIAIRAEDLGKSYRIGEREPYYTLRDSLARSLTAPLRWFRNGERSPAPNGESRLNPSLRPARGNPQPIWALKDVSFEVRQGEVVGVIGRNGAGKSTLLKILAEITEPSEGCVRINGRVGSLLEVGTGFHPELTGRENIYLNGAILGMKKAEINHKFDEIVAFAEIERFLDTPVKHYSSGMYMRLAFSVAAHLEPEILLVDEVLAVGDAAFQKKCLGKIGDVAQQGRTVLFVSHNLASIQNFCQRCLFIDNGKIVLYEDAFTTIKAYVANQRREGLRELGSNRNRQGNGIILFEQVSFHHQNGHSPSAFLSGEDLIIKLGFVTARDLPRGASFLIAISVKDIYDHSLFLCSNELTGEIAAEWPRHGEVQCKIPQLPLMPGNYSINIYVAVNGAVSDWITDVAMFEVESSDFYGTGRIPPASHGRFLVKHSWSIDSVKAPLDS
jgi:lipopolysaccharide transport system ATP-binding protein